jgi:hypothetical protein
MSADHPRRADAEVIADPYLILLAITRAEHLRGS